MANTIPPVQQLAFHGVHTAGNPALRPRGTASVCENFRVMPGNWLRLRGGRKWRANISDGGEALQFMTFREAMFYGSDSQFAQIKFPDGSVYLVPILLTYPVYTPLIAPSVMEEIATAYDSGYARSNPIPWCNMNDRPVYYNGLGVREAGSSKPPFSVYLPVAGAYRYFGLDAYCPDGINPSAAFAAGAGHNSVVNSVQIYVGLYNYVTGHYSNGVYCGTIAGTAGVTGTITVSNLSRLKYATHELSERSELYFVFYATLDGGNVPYLIMADSLDGPYMVSVSDASASLSIAAGGNGWTVDTTSEMPQENYPPRPMRTIWYVNGRLYGALMSGGAGEAVPQRKPSASSDDSVSKPLDFSYVPEPRYYAAVVWSRSASDEAETDLLGDPLQSWPLTNVKFTPSFNQPVFGAPAADGVRSLVVTPTSSYLLEEQADGLHEWITVSPVNGAKTASSHQPTAYGNVWVDQYNQIVLLRPGAKELVILSKDYPNLLAGKTVVASDYLVDPKNGIDRYEVFCSDGTSVVHDFAVRNESAPFGEGYTFTNRAYTAAGTTRDWYGRTHHVVANTAFYTQECQPSTDTVPTTDENADGTETEIDGTYVRNWDDFGDASLRKQIEEIAVLGDGEVSVALQDSPLSVEHFIDFEEVGDANAKKITFTKSEQSDSDSCYVGKLTKPHAFWHKFKIRLKGHSTDDSDYATHTEPGDEGDLAHNFYGSILAFRAHLADRVNRAR
jgi:hypothetical protein